MTTLILVRHGQSVANLEERFAGHSDFFLTDLGRQQARLAGEYLLREHIRLDAVYASDLSRAWETGCIIAEMQGLTPIPTPALREIYAGAWEGKKFTDLQTEFPESFGLWLQNIGRSACDGGESIAQVRRRVSAAVQAIAAENEGHTVLLASHGAAIRSLEAELRGLSPDEVKDLPWVGNASLTFIEMEQGQARFLRRDIREHLGALASSLPANV